MGLGTSAKDRLGLIRFKRARKTAAKIKGTKAMIAMFIMAIIRQSMCPHIQYPKGKREYL